MTANMESVSAPSRSGTWLQSWAPEDEHFWKTTGKRLAWRTLTITTLNLLMAFIVWFVVSALVVRLPAIGFKLTTTGDIDADLTKIKSLYSKDMAKHPEQF